MNHYKYAAGATALGGAAGAGYAAARWPKMTSWGATDDEVDETLPGDDLVGQAKYRATHAVTIAATPEQVWPWLVQMGQGRGGLYSCDWLENVVGSHMHSVNRIEAPHLLVLGPDTTRDEAFASDMPYPCWNVSACPPTARRAPVWWCVTRATSNRPRWGC